MTMPTPLACESIMRRSLPKAFSHSFPQCQRTIGSMLETYIRHSRPNRRFDQPWPCRQFQREPGRRTKLVFLLYGAFAGNVLPFPSRTKVNSFGSMGAVGGAPATAVFPPAAA